METGSKGNETGNFTVLNFTSMAGGPPHHVVNGMGGHHVVHPHPDCSVYNEQDEILANNFSFWVEGVSQTTVAILGILGNILASVILTRKEMRNAFNLLLVVMACFDTTYLFGAILESFRKHFHVGYNLLTTLFPHFLYPLQQIAIVASIFMTVAIALERYVAVHYPLNYSQAMHEANALTKRIVKYVVSVTLLALLFTGTKFFEARVIERPIIDSATNETIEVKLEVDATDLRINDTYVAYHNWSRLIVMGIVPFAMLIFLNAGIYKDIKARKNRRLTQKIIMVEKKTVNGNGINGTNGMAGGRARGIHNYKCCAGGMANCWGKIRGSRGENGVKGSSSTQQEEQIEMLSTANNGIKNENGTEVTNVTGTNNTKVAIAMTTSVKSAPSVTVNESRRKKEDNLAVIFMGFIFVFLACHLLRLLMNIHELATLQQGQECASMGYRMFPVWCDFVISTSHLLLALNSATNILIYCCLSSQFRDECRKLFRKI